MYESHVILKLISKKNIIKQKICLTKNYYVLNVMFCGTPCMYSIRAGNFLCHQ